VTTAFPNLFQPLRLGAVELPNRIVMAPMTRNRAEPGEVASALACEYYLQRASAGLIITEGSQIDATARGPLRTPGIHSPEQIAAWRTITDAVHGAGGRIALQLWHTGRAGHPDILGHLPVSSSAIAITGQAWTQTGLKPYVAPRALAIEEIPAVVEQFARAAGNAIAAGFDAVEIHGANGYLVDQFLRSSANHRTDAYGGSIENRTRFMREVVAAVVDAVGSNRTGIRLSPSNPYQDMSDSDPAALFTHAARVLQRFRLAWLHLFDPVSPTHRVAAPSAQWLTPELKRAFGGPVIANGGFTGTLANEAIRAGEADAVSFGVSFLANPDLPTRLRLGAELNTPDPATFYSGEEKGYVDYPTLLPATLRPIHARM
jgi:N-ethylmaleimide reductase